MSPHYLVKHRCTNFLCNGDGNGGVSKLGCTEIHLIEPGVKVNGAYAIATTFLPRSYCWKCAGYHRASFLSFNGMAPLSIEHETLSLSWSETPDFITPALWPPNSPYLNPVDHSIWSVLQKVFVSR